MKRYIFAIMAVAAALFAGCVDVGVDAPRKPGQAEISLSFELPVADTLAVGTRSAADDAARENHIETLDIFVFDKNGDIIPGDEGHKRMTNVTTVNGKGRAQIYVTLETLPTQTFRQFYVVTNCPTAMLTGITTKTALENIVVAGAATMPESKFIMSGLTPVNEITDVNPTVNMSLRRMVSRVDIILKDNVTNFEITQARIVNARKGGYLYEKLDIENNITTPGGSPLVNYGFVSVAEESHKRNFGALLYCHENIDPAKDDATTTAVIVGGMYKGQEVFYRINLHDNASQAQIRRNYVYKVNILAVNGPGNLDPDAAILDAPQNIDYEIVDWDYSLHCDVVFDGKHYLGLSRSEFTFGKTLSTGTLNIVTNLETDDLTVSTCDENGNAASSTWLSGLKTGSKVDVTAQPNNTSEPRVGYLKVQSASKSRLKIIIKVQQYHSDDMLMSFSPSVIMAPTAASSDKSSVGTFTFPTGTQWKIESIYLLEDASRNWCRVQTYNVGQWYNSGGNANITLKFNVDDMNTGVTARTAVVTVMAKYSGIEEKKTITVSQTNATEDLSVSSYYIGKTSAPSVAKIDIMSFGSWTAYMCPTAKLVYGSATTAASCDWMRFANQNYTALTGTDAYQVTGSGSGSLYINFDAVTEHKDAYIIVDQGGKCEAIRVKRFKETVDKLNGYETMELPGMYQWGRVPDGYESNTLAGTLSGAGIIFNSSAAANTVKNQPRFKDLSFGKIICPGGLGMGSTSNPKNYEWLSVDLSATPVNQRDKTIFWDAKSIPSDNVRETNLTGVKTEFDPCPDGWRVPTAREMENIFTYGPNLLDASASNAALNTCRRQMKDDNGKTVSVKMFGIKTASANDAGHNIEATRFAPGGNTVFNRQGQGDGNNVFTYYWTSTVSESGGPYMLRIWGNDPPEVLYTAKKTVRTARGSGVTGTVTQTWPDGELEVAASMYTRVRCIRDNQTEEELIVSKRRTTVDYEAQTFTIDLEANNIVGMWNAVSSDPSWLTIEGATSGSDDATLTMRVTQNNWENREGYIRITTPSGSVANIVVRQTDHTGVKFDGIWWRDRNLGATEPDLQAANAYNNATIGDFYFWGTVNKTRYETPTVGVITRELTRSHWNKNSAWDDISAVGYRFYPRPVKNEKYDPCPPGWRIPTPAEWCHVIQKQDANAGVIFFNVGGYSYNRKITSDKADRFFCFSTAGASNGSANGALTSIGSNSYYHSSELATTTTMYVGNLMSMGLQLIAAPNQYGSNIRCVQDIPDDWEEAHQKMTFLQ